MAEQNGLPVEQAERGMSFQDAFTYFGNDVLLPLYEDQISAIWVEPTPATKGHVQFVAEVPQEVKTEAASRGLDIAFMGGGEISMAEHDLRSELAVEALIAAGYGNLLVFSDRKHGTINIELRVPEGAHQPDDAEVLALVRERVATYRKRQSRSIMLEGRAAEIQPTDIVLSVTVSSEPVAGPATDPKGD